MITNFLSNKWNLIILQCLLYTIVGYIMGSHLTMSELIIVFVMILLINFITHIRGVSQGMLYNQLMNDNSEDFVKFIKKYDEKNKKKFKEKTKKINKKKLGE